MMRIGLLWRGDPHQSPDIEKHRLRGVFDALSRRDVEAVPVVYADEVVDSVREKLLSLDAVLVWIDPITDGRDRSQLDPMLADVAAHHVWVSAHPDTILKIGTKEVLFRTRGMSWGTDTRLYTTLAQFRDALPKALAEGRPRVLKQHRGNGGNGVWKIEAAEGESSPGSSSQLRVRHARRGSVAEEMTLEQFIERCVVYFDGGGRIIDQLFQPRLVDGMVRCYLVHDRVAGFGEQRVNMLFPAPVGASPNDAPLPGPRLYYPPTRSDLQLLKQLLESEWVPELCRLCTVDRDDLPAIWDADFLYGPKTASGEDTYVLCEINVSSVFPFPDSALEPLADTVVARVQRRKTFRANG